MNTILVIFVLTMISSPFLFDNAFAQTTVTVDENTPCFMDYAASTEMWKNCGFDSDFIKATLMPFEYVMGGYFTLVIVSILVMIVYIKYQTVIYPLLIGFVMLPLSWWAFPEMIMGYALILAALGFTAIIKHIVLKQASR